MQNGGSRDSQKDLQLAFGESAGRSPDDHQARDKGQMLGQLGEKRGDHVRGGMERFRGLAILRIEHGKPFAMCAPCDGAIDSN